MRRIGLVGSAPGGRLEARGLGSGRRSTGRGGFMAWERRPSGRDYYRSHRRGDRVVKHYFGRGRVALVAADLDDRARRRRAAEAEDLRRLRAQLGPADAALKALEAACQQVYEATLLAAGFRRQNYSKWRRR